MKYMLTTGVSTDKVELYVLDLFKLYFSINPGDIPYSNIGFNKTLTNVTKPSLESEVKSRISKLVDDLQDKFQDVSLSLDDVQMIDESTFKVAISANSEMELYEISSGLY